MYFPLLVQDVFGALFPHGLMEFVVPGAVAAFLFVFILYKLFKDWGWIDGI